jgi:hypothetical protein
LRQEILEGQGWRFHRIWSTDWFYRRSVELKHLKAVLEAARSEAAQPRLALRAVTLNDPAQFAAEEVPPSAFIAKPYEVAMLVVARESEPHELLPSRMAAYVKGIVDIEGPIHDDEIARRVANLFGKDRAGSRIRFATKKGLKHLAATEGNYKYDDGFWFTEAQAADVPIRDRASASTSLQSPAMLPPLEIRAAVLKALEDNGAVSRDKLSVAVARLFGFQRTGPELRSVIDREIGRLIRIGQLREDGQVISRSD